ncbi:serine/threonine protein kinase [Candidatus Bathyarchaeota archaeon]|nr:serine/threonine protein kinase [Candidatus Bathyarchaeota archaeon]MBS7630560.1 serine/threonine protein kinase [Candidatus Bathyarchaeota archaeon]
MTEFIPIENILKSKAAPLICYPRFDEKEAEERLRELETLRVDGIELRGRHSLNGLPILGKGKTSIVTAACFNGRLVALKMRRTDSSRCSMDHEAEKLRLANLVNVGPRLLVSSNNFIIMEFVEGEYFQDWLLRLESSQKRTLARIMKNLMQQARKLDEIGLDHGELSRAPKHIIIKGECPVIIDFESASLMRKPSNLQSLINYFYFNKKNRETIGRLLHIPQKRQLTELLKKYKDSKNEENYESLIKLLSLEI